MKYVVIFKARIKHLDPLYFTTAQQLRQKAINQYGCIHFEALTEGVSEIALSYWNDLSDIQAWHLDAEHQVAQQLGQKTWYERFSVDICEIVRQYEH
jgi:heme-degrading monooxygenase HmoA